MAYIYTIHNKITNKYYVGESLHPYERWEHHIYDLNNNKHHSHKLQASWNKYGAAAFEFSLECEISNDQRFQKEKEIISKYNSYINGYNETTGGDNPGYETLQRIVYCYDYNGNYLNKFFLSGREASRELGIDQGLLQKICTGQRKSAFGNDGIHYRFSYVLVDNLEPIHKCRPNTRAINQYDSNHNFVQSFESCTAAKRYLNTTSNHIFEALKNHTLYNGYY